MPLLAWQMYYRILNSWAYPCDWIDYLMTPFIQYWQFGLVGTEAFTLEIQNHILNFKILCQLDFILRMIFLAWLSLKKIRRIQQVLQQGCMFYSEYLHKRNCISNYHITRGKQQCTCFLDSLCCEDVKYNYCRQMINVALISKKWSLQHKQ